MWCGNNNVLGGEGEDGVYLRKVGVQSCTMSDLVDDGPLGCVASHFPSSTADEKQIGRYASLHPQHVLVEAKCHKMKYNTH